MATPVEMPQLGNTVEECLITRWLKREGDTVAAGDTIVEIETDKTTFEVTSPIDGTVLATFFEEGALVPVFTNIVVIGAPGEAVDAFRPGASAQAPVPEARVAPSPPPVAFAGMSAPLFSPRAKRFAAQHDFHPASLAGSGPGGRVLEMDVRRAYEAGSAPAPAGAAGPAVSTAALAVSAPAPTPEPPAPRTSGPDPRAPDPRTPGPTVHPTPGPPEAPSALARVVSEPVPAPSVVGREAPAVSGQASVVSDQAPVVSDRAPLVSEARVAIETPSAGEPAPAATAPSEPAESPSEPAPAAADPVSAVTAPPVSGLRATIARRMRESLASTAQYTMHSSADATGLLTMRARMKASDDRSHVTINDLVIFCTIQALLDAPDVNAEFVNGRIVLRPEVHIAFACDTPRGLLAPVVRNADVLSVTELASRMGDLTRAAVDGTIQADDLSGATFTISNLGSLGIESFTPLINPPQVAILGVGAIQLRPVRTPAGVEFVDSIGLSLTCDHQAIDGAPGARFLKIVAENIEHIESVLSSDF
jgi:pyruvate dehydrogenase E2 component (dihydrolipoamide acetyltransferase)